MLFFERDIAIDLGTSSTLVYVRGKGVAIREPSVVAVEKSTGRLLKVGEDAQKMLGRTPANIVAIHPIVNGVISDYDMTTRMLQELLSRVTGFSFFKPRVIICVPSSITGVEERATIDAVIEAGARKVYLLEKAVATSVGAGIDINKPEGHMIIDIGGGTTEVAVVSMGGVVECESIKTAGDECDEAIVRYIRRKHNVLIGKRTAEELKIQIGSAMLRPDVETREVKGRDQHTGLPKTVTVNSNDMQEALKEPVEKLVETIHMVLERTPPELNGDLSKYGITMSGGGSLLWGLDRVISNQTGVEAVVVDDTLACTAYGAGKMLRELVNMQDGMINLARRKQMK